MEIFVTGATGAVGRPLVEALVAEGHHVLAATRHPEAYEGPATPVGFDLDATGPVDPGRAAHGADAAYYLVHALERPDFEAVDRTRAQRFADLWGPDRPVVYLGGLGIPGLGSAHLRSRHEVGAILRGRAATVELRASIVIGAGSLSFQLLARLGRIASWSVLPLLVPTASATRTQPIAEADLLAVLVEAVDLPPGSYDIGGPDVVGYDELIARSAAAQGRRPRIRPVVPLAPEWLGPASALMAGVDPWATSALFASMGTEAVVRPGHRLPGARRETTGLDDAIAAALAAS
jgi:uncharacterized protein YbjT (DUF2867 family)